MTETAQTPFYTLTPGDKVVPVMAYTANAVFRGEVVVRDIIRVSTWLRTGNAPDRVRMYGVKVLSTNQSGQVKPASFKELYIATSEIYIFHLIPPAKDPLDYDATEPNRKMEPVSLLIANFRVDGHLRMAAQSSLGKFLEVVRENFTSIYDAKIYHPSLPAIGTLAVPYVIVRQEATVFTVG